MNAHDALDRLKELAHKGMGEISTDLEADGQKVEGMVYIVRQALDS